MSETVTVKRGSPRYQYRSLFWPIILIGVGAIWLLGNLGVFSMTNLAVAARLWPLILVVIGLDMLFGRTSPALGALIGIGTVIVFIGLMLIGPSLGMATDLEVKSDTFTEAVDDAQSARIDLDLGVAKVTVNALSDSNNLFNAAIDYVGEIEFEVSGETDKVIRLHQVGDSSFNGFFGFFGNFTNNAELTWEVGLSPDVPLQLTVGGGVGEADFDLSGIQLTGLEINVGVGSVVVQLPEPVASYQVNVNGGVGDFTITLPEDAAVRINANTGVGDINVSSALNRVGGGDDNPVGDDGVWETDGFASADVQITIEFDGGVGNLNVR